MRKTNTGGAAFPLHSEIRPALEKEWCGMTLRDYFAAKAMQGFDAKLSIHELELKIRAEYAYAVADAMLKAREQ